MRRTPFCLKGLGLAYDRPPFALIYLKGRPQKIKCLRQIAGCKGNLPGNRLTYLCRTLLPLLKLQLFLFMGVYHLITNLYVVAHRAASNQTTKPDGEIKNKVFEVSF